MPSLSRTLSGGLAITGGAVLSVFGRAGSVVAALGDYTSSLITNASGVAGVTVTAALDALQAALDAANTAIGSKADTTYVNTQLATKADRVIASVVYTAAATTLQAADADRSVGIDSALSNTLTIPPGVFPVGQVIAGTQLGVGRTLFAEGAGVTIRSRLGRYTGGQFAVWTLYQRTANVWELSGDLVAS